MPNIIFNDQLDRLESQLKQLVDGMIDGDPVFLQDASATFQQLTVELLQIAKDAQRSHSASFSGFKRISGLSSGMATFRENLLRRSAYIDSALSVLIPTTGEKSTYAGSRVYGGPARRSGSFMPFSA